MNAEQYEALDSLLKDIEAQFNVMPWSSLITLPAENILYNTFIANRLKEHGYTTYIIEATDGDYLRVGREL